MRLAGRDAAAFLRRPDARVAGVLLSGEPARVAEARDALLGTLLGLEADEEMRLARLAGAEARRDPASLLDALKATGFFPGPRAVLLEEATDGLADAVAAALDAWREGDARLVATGGALAAKGALRKLFEGRRDAAALVFYDDPLSEAEARALLAAADLGPVAPEAAEALLALAPGLDPGEFRSLLGKLALHRAGGGATTPEAVAALAPGGETDLDALLLLMTEGRQAELGLALQGLGAQGVGPVQVAVALGRHARALLAVAGDPGGPQAGLARLRPPVGGARREALLRGASWPRARMEDALRVAVELDLRLRSSPRVAAAALVERALLRLARPAREA